MIRSLLKSFLWKLPYEVRRTLYRKLHPETYQSLQALRNSEGAEYSLRAFLQKKIIFVHIPKCAGISIIESLVGGKGGGHLKLSEYALALNAQEFSDFFKFSFVRNPWDKIASAFHFLSQGGMNDLDRQWSKQHLSPFRDFAHFVEEGIQNPEIRAHSHFQPQRDYLCFPGSNRIHVDFLGRFEKLDADFGKIAAKLGLSVKLAKLNETKQKKADYRDLYTEKTKKIIADLYRDDIRIFGYSFEN